MTIKNLSDSEGRVVGTSQAAEILGTSRDRVAAMCRKRTFLHATQDGTGKPWHIPVDDILKYI